MKARQTNQGMQDVIAAFSRRGFRLVDEAAVNRAVQDSHLDLSSNASWTPQNLAAIGSRSAANLVVLFVITDTHQGYRHGFLLIAPQREGEAKTKLWIVDTKTQAAIVDGVAKAGKSRASMISGYITHGFGEGSSSYVLKAVGDAVTQSLADFLKPYPDTGKTTTPFIPVAVATAPRPPVIVPAVTPAVPAPVPAAPPQSVFIFANGARAVGTLISFDGSFYTVSTTKGMRKFKTAAIKAVYPVTATAAQR